MPYTRNTRIKVTEHLHKTNYKAQVEYKYPLLGIKVWENFSEVEFTLTQHLFFKGSPLPWQADVDCINNSELDEVKGLDWAKAQIDQYHKLFDESEFIPVVKYVKYP
jgi:hypothetical protein